MLLVESVARAMLKSIINKENYTEDQARWELSMHFPECDDLIWNLELNPEIQIYSRKPAKQKKSKITKELKELLTVSDEEPLDELDLSCLKECQNDNNCIIAEVKEVTIKKKVDRPSKPEAKQAKKLKPVKQKIAGQESKADKARALYSAAIDKSKNATITMFMEQLGMNRSLATNYTKGIMMQYEAGKFK